MLYRIALDTQEAQMLVLIITLADLDLVADTRLTTSPRARSLKKSHILPQKRDKHKTRAYITGRALYLASQRP